MAFRHGKNGSAKIGTTVLKILSWSAEDTSELEISTNTTSSGHNERTAGCDGLAFTIEAQWDATTGPIDATIVLIPGTEITSLFLGVGGSSTNGYTAATAIIEKLSSKMAVKNVVTWTVSGYAQGAFTRPAT